MSRPIHRHPDSPKLPAASLAEIEQEISDILDGIESVQCSVPPDGAVWQIAEAVRGLAWALGSLAIRHEDLAVTVATISPADRSAS